MNVGKSADQPFVSGRYPTTMWPVTSPKISVESVIRCIGSKQDNSDRYLSCMDKGSAPGLCLKEYMSCIDDISSNGPAVTTPFVEKVSFSSNRGGVSDRRLPRLLTPETPVALLGYFDHRF